MPLEEIGFISREVVGVRKADARCLILVKCTLFVANHRKYGVIGGSQAGGRRLSSSHPSVLAACRQTDFHTPHTQFKLLVIRF